MTRAELHSWANRNGWTQDNWGHFKKERKGKLYRLKLQARSVRLEVRCMVEHTYGPPQKFWTRLRSAYYGELSLSDDDSLLGMTI